MTSSAYRLKRLLASAVSPRNACAVVSGTVCNRPLSNYASVPANNNLKSRLRARKYSKCMKTWHEASTSGYCSRELKRNSKVVES